MNNRDFRNGVWQFVADEESYRNIALMGSDIAGTPKIFVDRHIGYYSSPGYYLELLYDKIYYDSASLNGLNTVRELMRFGEVKDEVAQYQNILEEAKKLPRAVGLWEKDKGILQ